MRVSYFEQSLTAAATAAAMRVVGKSASLTTVSKMDCIHAAPLHTTPTLPLSDLLAAGAASVQATRLRKLTSVQLDADCAVQQLQALQHCTGLTHLDISGSEPEDWLPEQGHQAAVELTTALQGMRRLVRLQVRHLQFEGSEAALASALQPLTHIQHLHVWCSGLGEAELAALAPALSAMPGLQMLDFSNNSPEGVERAEALCGLLDAVPRLTHLDVSGTSLWAEGAVLLAPA